MLGGKKKGKKWRERERERERFSILMPGHYLFYTFSTFNISCSPEPLKLGFQLMWMDVRVSSRLLGQVVRGHALTRREREQVRSSFLYTGVFIILFILTYPSSFISPIFNKCICI